MGEPTWSETGTQTLSPGVNVLGAPTYVSTNSRSCVSGTVLRITLKSVASSVEELTSRSAEARDTPSGADAKKIRNVSPV
jgi:hypothetical protein